MTQTTRSKVRTLCIQIIDDAVPLPYVDSQGNRGFKVEREGLLLTVVRNDSRKRV